LSPHPDDESVGCGGALREHAVNGDAVHVVFLTSGEAGGHGEPPEVVGPRREREAEAAASILGIAGVEFWRLPDGRTRATADLSDRVAKRAIDLGAARVYAPHLCLLHGDLRVGPRLAANVRRSLDIEIRYFEVWTPLSSMDVIVDISDHIDAKLAAIRCYESQCNVMRFDEAALGLARWRGEMHSWPGGPYAEVFAWE
jgi:LmbE family N-acetylglucosaminyl deacetylase